LDLLAVTHSDILITGAVVAENLQQGKNDSFSKLLNGERFFSNSSYQEQIKSLASLKPDEQRRRRDVPETAGLAKSSGRTQCWDYRAAKRKAPSAY